MKQVDKSDWKRVKLGEVCSFIGGGTPDKNISHYYEGAIPWATVRDMKEVILDTTEYQITQEALEKSSSNIVPSGSLIIATRVGLGKVCILKQDTAINQDLKGVIHNESVITEYLKYWFLSKANYIIENGNGATVKGVTLEFLKKIIIPLPPLPIQQKIVWELDTLSEVISKKERQLSELDKLAQALFYNMFGDPVSNEKGWDTKTLGEIGIIGTGSTPNRKKYYEYYEGNIPWVKTTEVQNCTISNTEEHITEKALKDSNCKIYPKDTILIAMYGQGKTRGQIARLKIDATTNQACAAIILRTNISILFLYYELLYSYKSIRELGRGGNQKNLNLELVKKISIPLPPLPLQQQFAAKIEQIEKQKEAIRESLKEVQTLFDYTMDRYFQ